MNSDLHFTVAIGASYMSAPEAVASTVRGGRGGTPLPGAQHGEAAGWAGRMHDNQHECALHVGWTTSGRVEEFAQGGRLKEGKTQDGRDRCMTTTSTTLI